MRINIAILISAAAIAVNLTGNANASFIASTSTNTFGTTGFSASNASQTVGWDFQVTQAVTINALGIWDDSQDGLNLSHGIAIYNTSGPLIASANVPAGTTTLLVENTRWVEIAAVSLLPNITYSIMADFMCVATTSGGDSCNVLAEGNISYDALVSQENAFFSDPLETIANGLDTRDAFGSPPAAGYLGPNFGFIDDFSVPEPATLMLLGLGIVGIGNRRRKQIKVA